MVPIASFRTEEVIARAISAKMVTTARAAVAAN